MALPTYFIDEFYGEKTKDNYMSLSGELKFLSRLLFNVNDKINQNKTILQSCEFEIFTHSYFLDYLHSDCKPKYSLYLEFAMDKIKNDILFLETMEFNGNLILPGSHVSNEDYIAEKIQYYIKDIRKFSGNPLWFATYSYNALMINPLKNHSYQEYERLQTLSRDADFFCAYMDIIQAFMLRTHDIELFNYQKEKILDRINNP